MKKITIFTEDVGDPVGLAGTMFDNLTAIRGDGLYRYDDGHSAHEESVQIIIIGPDNFVERARILAARIKLANKQESVGFLVEEIKSWELI